MFVTTLKDMFDAEESAPKGISSILPYSNHIPTSQILRNFSKIRDHDQESFSTKTSVQRGGDQCCEKKTNTALHATDGEDIMMIYPGVLDDILKENRSSNTGGNFTFTSRGAIDVPEQEKCIVTTLKDMLDAEESAPKGVSSILPYSNHIPTSQILRNFSKIRDPDQGS